MDISSTSLNTALASAASAMSGQEIQSQIVVAILKQTQDQQAQLAESLLNMMRLAPSLDGTGRLVNACG